MLDDDMKGHVTVIGWVTGVHLIEDIKVTVPYGTAVTIPAEAVVRSRDLQIAIQQKRVVEVANMMGNRAQVSFAQPAATPPSIPPAELEALRNANDQLTRSVEELRKQNATQQSQFQAILDALGTMSTKEPTVVHHHHGGGNGFSAGGSDVVGGDVPKYIPSQIKTDDTTGRISMQTSTSSDEADFDKSVSKLRELRKKQSE